MSELPILIIGGAGKTGARVNALLRASGVPTRPVSRSTSVPFDWTRSETWPAAFAGVSMAYVTYQPDLAVEGASDAIAEVSRLARENGLKRVVLLSGRGEPGAQRAEAALQQSGVPWTIVRASWFDQNFSEGYLLDGVLAGEIALPAGAVPEPFIDADDIAEVVVAAGRPVHYRQIGSEEFADGMRPHVPEEYIALLLELFTVVLDGRNSDVAHGVEQALGRPARDFADYARRIAATGVWRA
ncbi:NmrA family transcriptional regulator [Bradyrhizobium sp. SRL28]|uniref:SDR family oxidoreductase n=1 Tax=Bradyrhizobium sp. SRL28 TaxID=2836178 RepID=UPI001BDE9CFE|nr:NmrA family transcriptional regulator [Bradyrhizobium sp. SRL28]MBT1512668.1 NmrA family transcriptional regulator [Bradyrhizobium sp. SRL28]